MSAAPDLSHPGPSIGLSDDTTRSRAPGTLRAADPVIFDLDGTLTASGPGILASVRYALTRLGEPIPSDEILDRFIGPPLTDSFQTYCGMDHERAWDAVRTYREYYARSGQFENSVYDGIVELLGSLRDRSRVLAVGTSKAQPYAESILTHFGLAGFFTTIVGSELDGRRVRKAEVLAEVVARLGCEPDRAVMIGDRSHDVVGAAAVGIPCVGALWGYGSAAELTEAGAVALAATPAELGVLLGASSR